MANPDENANSSGRSRSRKFKRKLTPFLCQEMLYDYAMDRLDSERKTAVEDYLKGDQECLKLLEGIRRSLEYTENLSRTELKPDVASHLRESENAISLGRRYSKWKSWPETVRWSLTALLVSASVAGIVSIVPWHKISMGGPQRSNSIEVAQIPNNSAERLKALQEANELDASATEGSGDEAPNTGKIAANDGEESDITEHSGDHEDPPAKPSANVARANPPLNAEPQSQAQVALLAQLQNQAQAKPTPIVIMAKPTAVPVAQQPAPKVNPTPIIIMANNAQPAPQQQTEPQSPPPERQDSKARGFVYRAFMTLKDLEVVGPKISELVREQGGEKAGEVELGWKRGTGRYYHFSMPGENEERLLEQLRAYGPVRISKDPHPRVMPEGQVRFILWIESAN